MRLDSVTFATRLSEAIFAVAEDTRIRTLLLEAVGPHRPSVWEEIPYWCGRAAGGAAGPQHSLMVVLALWRAATSILDEVQDEDTHDALWKKIGAGAASNIALALICTASSSLTRLVEEDVPASLIIDAYQRLARTGVTMTAGQDWQLVAGRSLEDLSLDDYHALVNAKTVAFCALGPELAARFARASPRFVVAAADLGAAIGRAHQAIGDYMALDAAEGKRDIGRVPTYPVLYADHVASPSERARLRAAWTAGRIEEVRNQAVELGAAHFLTLQLREESAAINAALNTLQRTAIEPEAVSRLSKRIMPLISIAGNSA